jgi:hypothetical protein
MRGWPHGSRRLTFTFVRQVFVDAYHVLIDAYQVLIKSTRAAPTGGYLEPSLI